LFVALIPTCFLGRLGQTTRRWLLALALIGFGVGPLLLAELNPPPDPQAQELIERYFAATYAIFAVWLGVGLLLCASLFAHERNRDKS
jgi:heme/copper-type cytochrome/quinol oxidase subunit 2